MPNLRARIEQLGMTHAAFAGLLGVTERTVQNWCAKGEAPQHVEMLIEAATELDYIGRPAEALAWLGDEVKRRAKG